MNINVMLGFIYILLAIWLLFMDKVSLGYMAPDLEGIPKIIFVLILISYGGFQIYNANKIN